MKYTHVSYTCYHWLPPLLKEFQSLHPRVEVRTIAVGLSIVAVELGFLLAYRVGWRVSLASVTANTTVTLVLLPTGMLLFRERLTPTNAIGLVFCVIGLVLVTR